MKLLADSIRVLKFVLPVGLVLSVSAPAASSAEEQSELISFEYVPLNDAIRMLARRAGMNVILDQKLSDSSHGSGAKNPFVTRRWENATLRKALEELLAEHKMALVENPATKVARITFAERKPNPVAASQVIGNTNQVPLMVLDVPLSVALNEIARRASLTVEIDPAVSSARLSADGVVSYEPDVTFRWENLSPAQALAAVVDAYDLEMVKSDAGDKYKISPKAKTESKPASSAKPVAK